MSKGLDKKGLNAYGTLFGRSSSKSKVSETTALTSSAPAAAVEEAKPLMDTANDMIEKGMAAANIIGAKDYMEEQLKSLKGLSSKGPMSFRVMALCGGVAMVVQCFMGSLSKFFSFSPLQALIEVYCGIFGVMVVILEGQDYKFLSGFRATLQEHAKFLTFTWGRGMFYVFAGSLMVSQFNLFDLAVGGWMVFTGATSIIVGGATANKLTELKKSMVSWSGRRPPPG
jgi:hypothetical protein